MRAILSTTIQLDDAGLISVPAQLVPATDKSADISFKMGDSNGGPLTQMYVDANGTVVPREQMTKTYEGVIIPKDAIDNINEAVKIKTLKIEEVMSVEDFPFQRVTGLYYVQSPKKNGNPKAFKLIAEALNGDVAITEVTIRTKPSLLAIFAQGGVVFAASLAYADRIAQPDESVTAHQSEAVSDPEIAMAKQLLGMKVGTGFIDSARDKSVMQTLTLIEQAKAGQTIEAPKDETPTTAPTGLMEALEASLKAQAEAKERVEA